MSSLVEIQSSVRDVVVAGKPISPSVELEGGRFPSKRLAIHRRNYEAGLVKALLEKFPGTVWLVGSEFVAAGAAQFVKQNPPLAPCIADYGWDFPRFLAYLPRAARIPYLNDFAQLEWCVGHASIATAEPALDPERLSATDPGELAVASLDTQAGLYYFKASWPVDELLELYVHENAPERLEFDPQVVWLQVRGGRGEFHVDRLEPAEFIFRRSLSEGIALGESAELALAESPDFDPAGAMGSLISEGLATRIVHRDQDQGESS